MQKYPIHYALISVSDKTGIIEFARELDKRKIRIISTGGTASLLIQAGIPVIEVSKYTEFPEMMNGRVKTLHSKICGGILYRRGQDDKMIKKYGIFPIDIVIVNFYPFKQSIIDKNCLLSDAIEKIDIGGPTMVSSAAKNYEFVAVVVRHIDYNFILDELDINKNSLTLNTRLELAVKAFKYLAIYNNNIANYFDNLQLNIKNITEYEQINSLPQKININFIKKYNMIYGENSHQSAAFYIPENIENECSSDLLKVQGGILSYNNAIDIDTAIECLKQFNEPACVIVKHSNPCGVAISDSIASAYKLAYSTDPISAFGGIIALNRELDQLTVELIIKFQFVEIIIAPSFNEMALKFISNKKKIKLIIYDKFKKNYFNLDFKSLNIGLLVQEHNLKTIEINQLNIVSKTKPSKQEIADAIFGLKVSKFVKSNAIVCAKNNTTIGIGAGQMSRIDSVKIASLKANNAGLKTKNSVMASDAFFPFRDGIDIAAEMGISCIIQPGGSIRDKEVIKAADEHHISMIFTKIRHFRH
ncbi:bifunctional phosphoribosylaminoimidazolecarboxamide formyltransferase/inosine monophosphate cyclohydrolase [Candidatus Pantoea edessiphila]|uniref:Bifunctional purine biosynthesis protein PurH n=1 Tax=Candidatus Pantoea edessiphila TaxID=2044610 RepID=A0A2P5T321_9GAMM|nr:bifunctional phosphoribosylaminoimidazolecarboxamide formyltransferase/IMP cyclohydrolase [Candidatus Pantoea edessiphila]PPI88953.1 bifunctional phosphoribosylaminoimidazolecarboxamide formyltransferase/inosine monophosphate cyclohydrolase [Candidatus Pantoea edessiphila]